MSCGVDARCWEEERRGDRDTSRAGADVEDAAHLVWLDPRLEARFDQLRDRRARHQHALIHIELVPRELHPLREIGRRYALAHATLEQRIDARQLIHGQDAFVDLRRIFVTQPGCIEDQLGRLVERIVRPVRNTMRRPRTAVPRARCIERWSRLLVGIDRTSCGMR